MEDSLAQRRPAGTRAAPQAGAIARGARDRGPAVAPTAEDRLRPAILRAVEKAWSPRVAMLGLKLEAGGKSARVEMLVASLKEAFAFVQRLNAAQPGFTPWSSAMACGRAIRIGPSSYRFSWRSDEPAGCVGQAPRGVGQCPVAGALPLALAALARGAGPGRPARAGHRHRAGRSWRFRAVARAGRAAPPAHRADRAMQACHTPASAPAAAMEQVRAQLRMALDQRKFAVMEQLGGAGLLLIDIRYRGEDAVRGKPAAHLDGCVGGGLVQGPDRGAGTAGRAAAAHVRRAGAGSPAPGEPADRGEDEAEHAGSAAMSRARVGMAAALLAACGVAGIARAGNVDIFPSQSWDSLSRATRRRTDKDRTRMRTRRPHAAQRSWSAQAADAVAAPLFARVGEWREAGSGSWCCGPRIACGTCAGAAPRHPRCGPAARPGWVSPEVPGTRPRGSCWRRTARR